MKARIRKKGGFSLPTIVGLGMIAGIWMLGTAALVIPSVGRITAERAKDVSRSTAEAALDWQVSQMNGNTSTYMNMGANSSMSSSVPSNVLPPSYGTQYTGNVIVAAIACPNNSYLYDQTIDPTYNNSIVVNGQNAWRVVTATVQPTGNAAAARTVRVILKPIYAATTNTTTSTAQGWGDPVSMFNMAAFGNSNIGGVGNMTTNSYDSAVSGGQPTEWTAFDTKSGDVGTNASASLTGNSTVGGSVVISNPSGNGSTVSMGPNANVSQKVITNGSTSGVSSNQIQPYTGDAVRLPPAPAAPSGSTDLGAISLSGNKSMTLTAGNYIVSSISIAGNATLNINSSAGPVNIYVQGSGSGGINIGGNGVSNGGVPANLRIWYSGAADTQIAGNGNFVGVIYAPNSNVKIAGNGEVYGSVVGNQVNFNGNGTFHYDKALGRAQDFMYTPPKVVTTTVTLQSKTIDHWQAVSWDEM